MMKMSSQGLAFLKGWEACRLTEYEDSASHLSIGWGHEILPWESFPNGITQAQADTLLLTDLAPHEGYVSSLNVPMSQQQADALIDLAYNVGVFGPNLLAAIKARDWISACEFILAYDHSGGQVSAGLMARRKAEVAIIKTGVYDSAH